MSKVWQQHICRQMKFNCCYHSEILLAATTSRHSAAADVTADTRSASFSMGIPKWRDLFKSRLWGRCVKIVVFIVIYGFVMSSEKYNNVCTLVTNCFCAHSLIVRRAGLLWSQQDFEWRWSVPLFMCLTVLEFSFILFDLCLLITFFNFIMNYVPIVTFWIFTYHKIWILSICSVLYEVIELFIF